MGGERMDGKEVGRGKDEKKTTDSTNMRKQPTVSGIVSSKAVGWRRLCRRACHWECRGCEEEGRTASGLSLARTRPWGLGPTGRALDAGGWSSQQDPVGG
jgi:hypothetical protein